MLGYSQLENILKDTEVTLMTKKNKKEIPVFVHWVNFKDNILCGMYTNRYGKLAIKQFDLTQYDVII